MLLAIMQASMLLSKSQGLRFAGVGFGVLRFRRGV